MTHRQYKRLRQWDLRTQKAYNAGVIEGMDAFHLGHPRPEDPDVGRCAPFDLRFYIFPGNRLEQYYRNNQRARLRGMVDGFDQAQEMRDLADTEDWIESQVEQGIAQMYDWLRGEPGMAA